MVAVVPARDEEWLIGRCLDALVRSSRELGRQDPAVSVRIVVVADHCIDGTERIARQTPGVDVLVTSAGRVGLARALGVEAGLRGLRGGVRSSSLPRLGLPGIGRLSRRELQRTWIANTDADSVVPVGWLAHQVELANAGADLVIGTVRPDPADLTDAQNERWLATHTPGRPNGHVHGANLGVRASVYRDARGFEPVGEHEDNLLVDRIRESSAVIVASDEGEVLTSGRFVGRTPGGYADYLAGSLTPEVAE